MIPKNKFNLYIPKDKFKPELLNELKNKVYIKNGFQLTFLKKETNDGYSEEQLNNSQGQDQKIQGVFNDHVAAQTVYKNYLH